jgi:3-methyl-2-oxobutanoate hydroxymethyltransferase
MSITSFNGGQPHGAQPTIRQKVTTTTIHDKKLRHDPITCLTAYDYATARLVDQAPTMKTKKAASTTLCAL